MGIRFYRPNGHRLNVKDFLAGQTGTCPQCGAKIADSPGEHPPQLVVGLAQRQFGPAGGLKTAQMVLANGTDADNQHAMGGGRHGWTCVGQ